MMVGTRRATGPVSPARFAAQWQDPVVGPELGKLGLERPEQLGALFIGGPDFVDALSRDTPPLVDDWPKRVSSPGLDAGPPPPEYAQWRDATAAAERFRTSPLIARLWPDPLRTSTLPWFRHQSLINRFGDAWDLNLDRDIESLHTVLSETDLRTPVLWALQSNADMPGLIDSLDPAQREHPEVQYHLGVRLLSERRYAEAADPLRRAEAARHFRRDAFRLRVYALCQAGKVSEAQQLTRERYAEAGAPDPVPAFWAWMGQAFSIDPASERLTFSGP